MIRKLTHPLFLLFALVYVLNRFFVRPTGMVFSDGYLNDLLCMPLVLYLTKVLLETIFRLQYFKLSLAQVVFATIYFGLFFEWFLPSFSSRYTADPLDVLMYAIGSLVFLLIQQFRSARYPNSRSR